jgi:hypothetical protein
MPARARTEFPLRDDAGELRNCGLREAPISLFKTFAPRPARPAIIAALRVAERWQGCSGRENL